MKYTISILAYQGLQYTKRCIESILRAGSSVDEAELILTDNHCTDGTAEYFDQIASTHPHVRVVHNAENLGFIEPNRKALELAQGEFFVLLNNDAEVPRGWLEKLRYPFDVDPMMGLTGPEGGCCGFSDTIQGIPSHTVEYIEGACVMGRVSVLRKVGLFDPHLEFAYWEDVDLALRLRERGYNLRLCPFHIQHVRSATSRTMPDVVRRYQYLNGQYVRRRWAGYFQTRRMDFVTIIRRREAWGDVLLTTPIIRALAERNPNSPIWVETNCPDVFFNNPHVLHVAPRINAPQNAWVVDLNMAYENRPQTHFVTAFAEKAGLYDVHCRTLMFPGEADQAFADRVLAGSRQWIAVHVGPTTWAGKNWPMDRWLEVIKRLPGPAVLVGNRGAGEFPAMVDLRGQTTPLQLAAVLARCRLYVGLDSFPLHVAQAMSCPVVGLFGVTLPEYILTDGSKAIGVRADGLKAPSAGSRHAVAGATSVPDPYQCMETISVEHVLEAVHTIEAT